MKKRILSISFIICIVVFTMFYVMQINMYYMNKIKSIQYRRNKGNLL